MPLTPTADEVPTRGNTRIRCNKNATQSTADKVRLSPEFQLNTFADLFCGVGGFHLAASNLGLKCVFASDIDTSAQDCYEKKFKLRPLGDIMEMASHSIPDHDVTFAGLPCQPFSIIGKRQGFSDNRSSLFLEAARIVAAKRPRAVVIENVRQLTTIDGGKALQCIITTFETLGYSVDWRILNALNFGLPQKRERVIIVVLDIDAGYFQWPTGDVPMTPLEDLLEPNPDDRHFLSARIRESRLNSHQAQDSPTIWHENKGGNVSSHPYSCALRAGASYNYLLVDGKRRLTPREMFRLQGFPDEFQLPRTVSAARKLSGNAVPVNMIQAVIRGILSAYGARSKAAR